MKLKRFEHDGDDDEFLGHYFGHDIYIANRSGDDSRSMVARYGDEWHEYASTPLAVLKICLHDGGRIGGKDSDGASWSMPYVNWVFSDRSIPSTSAMILALAIKGMKS